MFTQGMRKTVAAVVVASFICSMVPMGALRAEVRPTVNPNPGIMPVSGSSFKPVQFSISKEAIHLADCEAWPRPPERPGDDVTDAKAWADYYARYCAYIEKYLTGADRAKAWLALAKDFLKLSQEHPDRITAGCITHVLSKLTNEYKERWDAGADKEWYAAYAKTAECILGAANNFAKSDAFWKMSEGQQTAVSSWFRTFAIELSWRKELSGANSGIYAKIGRFFRTMLERGSINVKAVAFNQLMHLFRVDNWAGGNPEAAKSILKSVLDKLDGGFGKLLERFMNNLNNKALSDEVRGQIACALANVLIHAGDLGAATTNQDINGQIAAITQKLTGFMDGINNGSIKVSDGLRNNLLHLIGCNIGQLIARGQQNTEANAKYIDSFMKMANDSLLRDDNVGLQATALNILKNLRDRAKAKNDDALAGTIEGILNDPDFNAAAFIDNARDILNKTKNADYGAWLARALANVALVRPGDVNDTAMKDIVRSINTWIGNNKNLTGMRIMSNQRGLYHALAELAGQIFTKGSELGNNKHLQDAFVNMFGTIPGLRDVKVNELATKDVAKLISSLKKNGFDELATRLTEIFGKKTFTDTGANG